MNNKELSKILFGDMGENLAKWAKKKEGEFKNLKCSHQYINIYCIDTGEFMYKRCEWCGKKKLSWSDE